MGDLPELKAVAMRDIIADALRGALLDRRFPPGEAIVESALAAEMKVSRGPVREALLLLTEQGLVTHSQNRGFAVLNFTEADQDASDQVRYQLETLALRLARGCMSRTRVGSLQAVKDRMVEQFRTGDIRGRVQGEIDFHGMIAQGSGNSYLALCLQRVSIPNFTYGSAFRLNRPDLTLKLFDEQHQLYIDYLVGATNQSAAECVAYHLGFPVPAGDSAPCRMAIPA
ncbi:MAG: GntR family transcriptional regulator [Bryobacteraceae bacterium]